MSKEEYLNQLHKYLRKLPKKDYDDVMDYFEEYFQETDEAGAQKLIEELGTPKEAARELLANLLDKKLDSEDTYKEVKSAEKRTSKWNILWIACLTILALPIGAPLLVALVAVLFSVLICVAAALLCIFIFAFCFALAGGKLFIRGLLAIPTSISGFGMISGSGLIFIGLSILLTIFAVYLCKWCGLLFVKLAHWISNRKRGKKA